MHFFLFTRLEIFLIHLELESLSKRTANPTDFLQINNKEKYFGEKNFIRLYNESNDAVIVFKSDIWFNKQGFFLYFNARPRQIPIDLVEEFEEQDIIEEVTKLAMTSTQNPDSDSEQANLNTTQAAVNETSKSASSAFKLNINDLTPAAFKKDRSNSIVPQSEQQSDDVFSKHTTKAMLTLMILIVILSSIIIFLVLKNK